MRLLNHLYNDQDPVSIERIRFEVLYASVSLFGCFLVFLLRKSLFTQYSTFDLNLFGTGVITFLVLWLIISLVIGLLRRTPLILVAGFLALIITSVLGVLYMGKKVLIIDLYVLIPAIFLWSLGYYFLELYSNTDVKNIKAIYLSCLLFTVVLFFGYSWFLLQRDEKTVIVPNVVTSERFNRFADIKQKGIFDVRLVGINTSLYGESLPLDIFLQLDSTKNKKSTIEIQPQGVIYFPETKTFSSIVLIKEESYNFKKNKGLHYLGEHLASRGFLTVLLVNDTDFTRKKHPEFSIEDIYWLKGLSLLETINGLKGVIPNIEIEADNTVLIGIGEEVNTITAATYISKEKSFPINAQLKVPDDIEVASLIAIAPTNDVKYDIPLYDLDYLSINCSYPPTVNFASSGDQLFNLVDYRHNKISNRIYTKSSVNIYGGDQGYFSSTRSKASFPGNLLLKERVSLDPNRQQEIVKSIITAAIEKNLNYRTELSELFIGRNFSQIFPLETITTRSISSNSIMVSDFELNFNHKNLKGLGIDLNVFNALKWKIAKLENNKALEIVFLDNEVIAELTLPTTFSKDANFTSKTSLDLSLAVNDINSLEEIYVEIETKRGKSMRRSISDINPLPVSSRVDRFKFDPFGLMNDNEIFFESYSIPLYLFFSSYDYTPWLDIEKIRIIIDPKENLSDKGILFIDDINFRN